MLEKWWGVCAMSYDPCDIYEKQEYDDTGYRSARRSLLMVRFFGETTEDKLSSGLLRLPCRLGVGGASSMTSKPPFSPSAMRSST